MGMLKLLDAKFAVSITLRAEGFDGNRMNLAMTMAFRAPMPLLAGTVLCLLTLVVAYIRGLRLSRACRALMAGGLVMLALSAGEPVWRRPVLGEVVVMVDLSPSTRTAAYRDPRVLLHRVDQLLGSTARRMIYFSDENRADVPMGARLPDMPSERTIYVPPNAAAVLLFSDARFELPAGGAPTYCVVDAMLEDPADAAIRRLELRGNELAISVTNQTGEAASLDIAVGGTSAHRAIGAGAYIVTQPIPAGAKSAVARLRSRDFWPENDTLALDLPASRTAERWWVGGSTPAGFRAMAAADLPAEASEYLSCELIVLENIPAGALPEVQLQRMEQYVRDLGGGLLILGGNRAFAAGQYQGSALDAMSPLASSPPTPTLHWMLLADSSGSMSAAEGGSTRWELARQSMLKLLPALPPEDLVSIGSFAERLRWWSQGKSAKETRSLPLPPGDVSPNGPTNLDSALRQIIASADGTTPAELLILSDADADIADVDALEAGLKQKRIRLHLLAIGEGRGLPALRRLAAAGGGMVMTELRPANWAAATRKLFAQAAPMRLRNDPAEARFVGLALANRAVSPWNRTWLKKGASTLAEAEPAGEKVALAARWQYGSGQVIAAAFSPTADESAKLASMSAQPARDPRLKVTWELDARIRVRVDAEDGGRSINGLKLSLELAGDGIAKSTTLAQISPGRYEAEIPAPRASALATVRLDGKVVDRAALPARYAPEFDAIGNDHEKMKQLADLTGGKIVPPNYQREIEFSWPQRETSLAPWLALLGAALLGVGLIAWQRT
jgi:hypothetical protein